MWQFSKPNPQTFKDFEYHTKIVYLKGFSVIQRNANLFINNIDWWLQQTHISSVHKLKYLLSQQGRVTLTKQETWRQIVVCKKIKLPWCPAKLTWFCNSVVNTETLVTSFFATIYPCPQIPSIQNKTFLIWCKTSHAVQAPNNLGVGAGWGGGMRDVLYLKFTKMPVFLIEKALYHP